MNNHLRSLLIAACGLVLLGGVPAIARTIGLEDLEALVQVRSPRISPDGKSIVIVVARPDYEENRFESHLVLVDVESGSRRQLTHARPAVSSPRWSAAGDRLAFLAKHETDGEKHSQVFVLPIVGGEARLVTEAARGVARFEWMPDGKQLVYIAADEPPEEPKDPERHNKSFVVGHHDYLATSAPPPLHVWLAPLEDGEPRRINPDSTVADGSLRAWLTVSPDGKAVAFSGYPADRPGDMNNAALQIVGLDQETPRSFGDQLSLVSWGRFSPDGRKLAFSRPTGNRPFFSAHHIFVADAAGGSGRNVTSSIDRTFYGAFWMPDGKAIVVGNYDGARNSVWVQPLEGRPQHLDIGPLNAAAGIGAPDLDVGADGSLAFIATEPHRPVELYYMKSLDAKPRRMTGFNDPISDLDLGRVEEITWEGPDGFHENGILIFPPEFDSEQRYPLVLRIHGGPMGASTESFDLLGQLLAARGWVVFEPNYRGSANLGGRYQAAVVHDAGDGPGRDVMAGLSAVKARGFVDEKQIGVSGWSYGGYMTSWLIGNYPGEWRAAVAGAPVTDYVDSYALSDVNTGFGWGFRTLPWSEEGQKAWRDQSPIAYLHRVKTPTLILCDTGDLRVPITESYKLYHALDDAGTPVEFVAYPVPGHFPGDPVHIRDIYRRWGDWFARWFEE